jgi:glutaconate CoA-transferase subunit B
VITDLGVLAPDPDTLELTLVELHPGATVDGVRAATGWDLAVAPSPAVAPEPTTMELETLRRLDRPATG